MRRSVIASALATALVSACASEAPRATAEDADVDASVTFGADVGASRSDTGDPGDSREFGAACFNFADEDADGSLDCGDDGCRDGSVSACCVGVATSACCTAAASTSAVVEGSCADGDCLAFEGAPLDLLRGDAFDVEACGTALRAFGPIGDATNHGRVILPRLYATTSAFLTLEATVHVGETTRDIAAAGFGIIAAQDTGPRLTPLLGVVASASTREIRVIAGDRVIATSPLEMTPCGGTVRLRLVLDPSGTFELFRVEGESVTSLGEPDTFEPQTAVRVAMFGQQPNPVGVPDAAWVGGLSVTRRACDVLIPQRPTTSLLGDATHDIADFSVFPAPTSGHDALVVSEGSVHWFSVNAATGALIPPAGGVAFANPLTVDGEVTDVDVFLQGSTRMAIMAVRDLPSMQSRLVLAQLQYTAERLALVNPQNIVSPSEAADFASFTSIDSPSAAVIGDVTRVAFRAFEGTRSSIRIITLNGASYVAESVRTSSAFVDGAVAPGLVHAPAARVEDAFDRDEVSDPELYEDGGVLRVIFAGRRGTRWSLGMLVASTDGTRFAPTSAAPFAPSGSGFDALGTLAPEFVRTPGADRLYYLGTDGVRRSIGLASQPR
jgi:hypothetical protein